MALWRRRRLPRRELGETAKWPAGIHLATISTLQAPTPHGCPPRRIVRSIPSRRPGPTHAIASRLPGVFSLLLGTIAAISTALFSKLRTARNDASRPVTRSSSPLSSARGMSAAPYALLSTQVASAFLFRSSSSRTRRDHRGRLPSFQWCFANPVWRVSISGVPQCSVYTNPLRRFVWDLSEEWALRKSGQSVGTFG